MSVSNSAAVTSGRTASWMITESQSLERGEPLVDRLLARRAADDAAEPVAEAVVGDEPPGLLEVRLRAGDDDPLDGRDDPRLLEDVDDERLAAEQQELLGERAPDAFADPPGEHDHPDLHAVLRLGCLSGREYAKRLPVAPGYIATGRDHRRAR